jgi:hypothetical protein
MNDRTVTEAAVGVSAGTYRAYVYRRIERRRAASGVMAFHGHRASAAHDETMVTGLDREQNWIAVTRQLVG